MKLYSMKPVRFLAILLASDGRTAPKIAPTLDRSRRIVQNWCFASPCGFPSDDFHHPGPHHDWYM